jgi:glycosyltransferase involved in cell wall biosynthesis
MGATGNIAAAIEKAGSLISHHIVAVSDHTAEELRRVLRYRRPIKKVFNGIDFSLFDELPKNKDKTVDCLYAGRLIEHKNVDQLVRAIALLNTDKNAPKVTCKIIGEGRERKRLEELSDKLGQSDYITFQDFLPEKEDIYKEMQCARIFVTPSTREGFGITVLEANACGAPVITSNDPNNAGRQLIIEGITGATCAAQSADIAAAVRFWLKAVPDQAAIKAHARIYDWEAQVDRQLEVYQL